MVGELTAEHKEKLFKELAKEHLPVIKSSIESFLDRAEFPEKLKIELIKDEETLLNLAYHHLVIRNRYDYGSTDVAGASLDSMILGYLRGFQYASFNYNENWKLWRK